MCHWQGKRVVTVKARLHNGKSRQKPQCPKGSINCDFVCECVNLHCTTNITNIYDTANMGLCNVTGQSIPLSIGRVNSAHMDWQLRDRLWPWYSSVLFIGLVSLASLLSEQRLKTRDTSFSLYHFHLESTGFYCTHILNKGLSLVLFGFFFFAFSVQFVVIYSCL